jgi:hypothetical protein
MAKFLQIRTKPLSDKETKAFEAKVSATALKNLFKCESVYEFSPNNSEEYKKLSKISTNDLEDFAKNICYTEVEKLGFIDGYPLTYEYIFSDDAEITPLSAIILKEDIKYSVFELDKNAILKLNALFDQFEEKDYIIGQLLVAEELWRSLKEIENDLNLDLVSTDGDNEIEERLSDIRDDVESLTSAVNSYITENPWEEKK